MSEWDAFPAVSRPAASEWDQFPTAEAHAAATPIGDDRAATVVNLRGIPIAGAYVDKGTAYLNALAAKIGIDPGEGMAKTGTISEMAAANEPVIKAAADQREKEHPIESTIGKVFAGTGALAPLGATALGAKALGLVGETLPAQMAAGVASGATIGGLDSAARGEDPLKGAITSGGFGAAGPVAGRLVGKSVEGVRNIVSPAAQLPTAEALKDTARAGYDGIKNLDVRIKPSSVQSVAQQMQQDFHNEGFRDYLAPKTAGVLDELAQPTPAGSFASFSDLHGMRRALGKAAQSVDPTEKAAASRAITTFDKYLENIPQADVLQGDARVASQLLKQSNANYAAGKRADLLQGKVDAADLQAASANSGANVDNALRQRVKDILKSPKLSQGFSQDELLQMQRVVRGTATGNVIRTIGNLLGGGGGLGSLITAGAGAMAAGPIGLAAPAAGTVIKKIGNRMTENQINKLAEMIRSRAPASGGANTAIAAALMDAQKRLAGAGRAGIVAGSSIAPAFSGQSVQ